MLQAPTARAEDHQVGGVVRTGHPPRPSPDPRQRWVRRVDRRPVVTYLHGTELKVVEDIRRGVPDRWLYAEEWDRRLVVAARQADRVIVISPTDRQLAVDLPGLDPDRIEIVPNGVDTTAFSPSGFSQPDRLARWRRWLVDQSQGWDESGEPGTIAHTNEDIDCAFVEPDTGRLDPALLLVGRFLDFKRVPLLILAYAALREALGKDAPPLVIWGGYSGEWEGEHPRTVTTSTGVDGVFFVGWHGHDELAIGFNCADVFVAPSVAEPFGQVYLEAMACGLPVIATKSGGPPSFVNTNPDRPNGWLVAPDDTSELTVVLIEAATETKSRTERGQCARRTVVEGFDWLRIADQVEGVTRQILA